MYYAPVKKKFRPVIGEAIFAAWRRWRRVTVCSGFPIIFFVLYMFSPHRGKDSKGLPVPVSSEASLPVLVSPAAVYENWTSCISSQRKEGTDLCSAYDKCSDALETKEQQCSACCVTVFFPNHDWMVETHWVYSFISAALNSDGRGSKDTNLSPFRGCKLVRRRYNTEDPIESFGKFAILVVTTIVVPEDYIKRFVEKANSLQSKVGVVLLSDEQSKYSTSFYDSVSFVFRNYENNDARYFSGEGANMTLVGSNSSHVFWFPLGYTNKFLPYLSEPLILRASERRYLWNFYGSVDQWKTGRKAVVDMLRKNSELMALGDLQVFEKFAEGDSHRYSEALLDSVFTLNPKGNTWDCFRIYEALKAGSIPVVEDPHDSLNGLGPLRHLGRHPLPLIKDWTQLAGLLEEYQANPRKMDELQTRVRTWWADLQRSYAEQLATEVKLAYCGLE